MRLCGSIHYTLGIWSLPSCTGRCGKQYLPLDFCLYQQTCWTETFFLYHYPNGKDKATWICPHPHFLFQCWYGCTSLFLMLLTIPEKPTWSLSKPTPSLVQCRVSSEPPIEHDFLFQSSVLPFLFNSCSPLIQWEKSGIVKIKLNPEQIQTNQIKENVLEHFNTHMML